MSRRREAHAEAEFGSDSFLDVISNMVGILIILILMAAFRAKRAPITDEELAAAQKPIESSVVAVEPITVPEPAAPPLLPTEPHPDEQLAAEHRAVLTQSARYAELIRQLEERLQSADVTPVNASLREALTQQQATEARVRQLQTALDHRLKTGSQVKASLQEEESELAALKRELDRLNRELQTALAQDKKKEKLKHKVSAIGTVIHGKEIYFRVARGRISAVPLEELSEMVGEKVRSNRDWLIKSNKHQGQVGPIDGFIMKYEVVREQASMVDDLRRGFGMVKLVVPRFLIEPVPGVHEEPVAEALQSDGLFVRRLAQTAPDTAITIWVYPDSFSDYRRLAEFAQQHGFIVAGRPLPAGMPIAGSSSGSRSVGQ